MKAFSLPRQLTHAQANGCARALGLHARASGNDWTVDVSALQSFDSSALAVLLDGHRQAQQSGQRLKVIGWPPRLLALAKLYGVYELLCS